MSWYGRFRGQAPQGLILVSPLLLPEAQINQPYTYFLSASGGIAPYAWSLISQSSTNVWSVSASGNVTGTPSAEESDLLTIRVTDSQGIFLQAVFTLPVGGRALVDQQGNPLQDQSGSTLVD